MLEPHSVEMVTNFFSFGEMRREWFLDYVTSPLFKTAEFFFTCNRVESAPRLEPTYDSDLTILDYPLREFQKIFFGVFPLYPYYTTSRFAFAYEKRTTSSQNFDFIGRRSR